jgi:hypothetical protein
MRSVGALPARSKAAICRIDSLTWWKNSVAGEAHVAVQAVPCQRVAFCLAELLLLRKDDELQQGSLADVAQQVTGFDVVVTAVQLAVVL